MGQMANGDLGASWGSACGADFAKIGQLVLDRGQCAADRTRGVDQDMTGGSDAARGAFGGSEGTTIAGVDRPRRGMGGRPEPLVIRPGPYRRVTAVLRGKGSQVFRDTPGTWRCMRLGVDGVGSEKNGSE